MSTIVKINVGIKWEQNGWQLLSFPGKLLPQAVSLFAMGT
jgi:hypothetical protein